MNIGGDVFGEPSSPADVVAQARRAEAEGFGSAWSVHFSRGYDALSTLAVAGAATERIELGHVFTAFHFPEIRTNLLIGSSADVNTSCPEFKVVAVDVRPVAEQASRTPAIAAAT